MQIDSEYRDTDALRGPPESACTDRQLEPETRQNRILEAFPGILSEALSAGLTGPSERLFQSSV